MASRTAGIRGHAIGTATVPLQGRVTPEARDAAHRSAAAAGITVALYLERLVLADAEHCYLRPPHNQGEFDVSA